MNKVYRYINSALSILFFPVTSLFSNRVGFSFFFWIPSGWKVYTRGHFISINWPGLESLEYFRHFIPRRGAVVFDIGGEEGLETLQFSRIVGKTGRVYTFECFPEHAAKLRKLAENENNITVIEKACWNKSQQLKFFQGHTPGSNTAVTSARGQRGQELADTVSGAFYVDAESLDVMWKELTEKVSVDFLKMDIEGAEYEALEGAAELLMNTDKVVIAAYHIRDGIPTAEKVARMLKNAGFNVRIDENLHVYGWR